MATTAALTENSRQGINSQISHCIGPAAWLSPNPRPGCGHAYDETPVDLVVYVRNDPVNLIDPDGLSAVTIPKGVVKPGNCADRFQMYGEYIGTDLQGFFDDNIGILTMMSFFEQQGSGSEADRAVWAAQDWTFINRWDLSSAEKALFYGRGAVVPKSFEATVTTLFGSDVFSSSGGLITDFADDLFNILSGPESSSGCYGLEAAMTVAWGAINARKGIKKPGEFYTPNPVRSALSFASGGRMPGHDRYWTLTGVARITDGINIWDFYNYTYNPPTPGKLSLPSPPQPRPSPPVRKSPFPGR